MPDEPLTWLLLILYFVSSMYFSASETAFMTANRFKLKAKAEDGNFSAKLAVWVISKLENSIVTLVVFNNLVNTLFVSLLTILLLNTNSGINAEFIATLIAVPLFYIFAETLPKLFAKRYNVGFSLVSAYLLVPLIIISYPIAMIFHGMIWLFKKIFRLNEDNIFTPADFENVIEAIEEQGIINEDASDLIISTLEFSETIVKDVLTPKQNIIAYDLKKFSTKSFNDFILKAQFSRIPIYDGTIDKIVGVVVIREYIKSYQTSTNVVLPEIMGKPYFVNYKITLTKMIEGFKRHNTHIAFVVDDHKKLIGMITMEDVLEELVGQIAEVTTNFKGGNA